MDAKVFVINIVSVALMPTTPRKARILLKEGKAIVYRKRPFTIQLLYKTGGATQPLDLGVDTGSQHIGIGVCQYDQTSKTDTALYSTEIHLRGSMAKRKLMETRKEYRRGRRYRKKRYRKPKFKYHTKRMYSEEPITRPSTKHMTHWTKVPATFDTKQRGWLPPSLESKLQHHIEWINRYKAVLPTNTKINIEVGRFDVAHMKDPTIHGELYQRGPQYGYENVKAYVFARDEYCCLMCGSKGGSRRKDDTIVKLIAHHVLLKAEGATDDPEFLATICDGCHTTRNHQPGGVLYQWCEENKRFRRGLRDATTMNVLRKRLYKAFPDAHFTYGNITAADRERFLMPKGHAADAVVIAAKDAENLVCNEVPVNHYEQVRGKKRSLHEATPRKGRKEPNREAKRNSKNTRQSRGYKLYDKVIVDSKIGWISGFASYGTAAYVVNTNGEYIKTGATDNIRPALSGFKKLVSNNNWVLWSGKTVCALSSPA